MQQSVHIEALRAATRVAFALTLLSGCSAGSEEESASTDSDLKTKKASEDSCHASTDASADVAVDASTPLSCEAVVAAAFPTEGNYPGAKQNVSKEVQSCCVEVLKSHDGLGAHRWDCCANATPGANIGLACTPWGPPVPPAMNWREVA